MRPTLCTPIQWDRLSKPGAEDLAGLFLKFIGYWTKPSPSLPAAPPDFQELTVRWSGSIQGTLVLRCTKTYLDQIRLAEGDRFTNFSNPGELFREMATLFVIYMVHSVWASELFELGPVLARPSIPGNWPTRNPQAACDLSVENQPVEIRLWIDPPAARGKEYSA